MTAWLTDTLLYTGLLIGLVLLLRRPATRYFGPQFAYSLWLLPALRLLLPPIELPASMAPAPAQLSDQALLALAMATEDAPLAAPAPTPFYERADLWLALWLASAAVFLAWRFAMYRRMRQQVLAEARPVGEVGKIRLVETPAVASPVAFGVFDKVVALPPFFMAMQDRAARDLAIAHELAHHQGHDIAANFAAQPLLALHWFNPIAWLGWRAMRRDQEAACDARVLAGCGREQRAAYAGLIAGFAAGPRLALAAPMACPILGEKSIIHRLRSLSMSDVSPSRRRLGRWLLAGGALALPLTASVSYAAAQDVQPVPVAPSAAPEAPLPPLPPEPPLPPRAPDAPVPPEAHGDRQVHRYVVRRGGDGKEQRQVFVFDSDHPLTEAQRKHFEAMSKEWEQKGAEWRVKGAEWQAKADEWRKMAEKQQHFALAFADNVPDVSRDCDKAGENGSRQWKDDKGRQHIVICERVLRDRADMAERQARLAVPRAMMGLRGAREMIANNADMSESVKREVLGDLDREIARLEAERK
jgi:beta-lactamase regulating signal transducer with metallopeptidase domain